ncbi:MAG TPA: glycosyltransferase family 4 protein [Vicinamibacteria bacterium]|nr:glycosyltransferase family 4 protein [Vicinamibacteria bacterium]
MRILYVASDQVVPGHTGGSVHVLEVARGLASRGHEVHAVVHAQPKAPAEEPYAGAFFHRVRWSPDHRFFRFRAAGVVESLLERTRADAVLERYYNFGGEGVRAASRRNRPVVLEVNSPVVDHPGSTKAALDALVGRPLRRYREDMCRRAAALISPLAEIVPAFARDKTTLVTWGANVLAFAPERRVPALRAEWGAPPQSTVVIFSGSHRPWHGVHVLEAAARRLVARDDLYFVFVGGERGPARGFRGRHLGRVPYESMPEVVASADVGVAPYDPSRLGQLRLGFYWSPLKIFEYMACGLPTVTIRLAPLTEIARDEQEGLFFTPGSDEELASALARLADDAALRTRLGQSARERVVARYSWAVHCAQVEAVLERAVREGATRA